MRLRFSCHSSFFHVSSIFCKEVFFFSFFLMPSILRFIRSGTIALGLLSPRPSQKKEETEAVSGEWCAAAFLA